jgi:AcrR family transcriptional regulator
MAEAKLQTRIRREQIAEAALKIVASEGVKRLSIAAVARRVGLVPSGIYRHFKNKDAMLDAVLELLQSRLHANVAATRADSEDAIQRLHGLFTRHICIIREGGQAFPRIIFSDEAGVDNPPRKARVRRIMDGYLAEIERLVREGQQQGRIDRGLLPRTVAMLFMGMIVPAGVLWHLTDGGFNLTQHAGRAWKIFEQALTARSTGGGGIHTNARRKRRTKSATLAGASGLYRDRD